MCQQFVNMSIYKSIIWLQQILSEKVLLDLGHLRHLPGLPGLPSGTRLGAQLHCTRSFSGRTALSYLSPPFWTSRTAAVLSLMTCPGLPGTDWTDYQDSDVSHFNPGQSVHVRAPKSLRANPIRLIRPKPAHATDSALKPLKINDFSQLFNPDASIYVQLQSGWSVWKFCYQLRNFNSLNTWKMNNSKLFNPFQFQLIITLTLLF